MSWQHWLLIAWLLAEIVLQTAMVGQKQEPTRTAKKAAYSVVSFVIWGVLLVWGQP